MHSIRRTNAWPAFFPAILIALLAASSAEAGWDRSGSTAKGGELKAASNGSYSKELWDKFKEAYDCLPADVKKASKFKPEDVTFYDSRERKNLGYPSAGGFVPFDECGHATGIYLRNTALTASHADKWQRAALVYEEFIHSTQRGWIKRPDIGQGGVNGERNHLWDAQDDYREINAGITVQNWLKSQTGATQAEQKQIDFAALSQRNYAVSYLKPLCDKLDKIERDANGAAKNLVLKERLVVELFDACKLFGTLELI